MQADQRLRHPYSAAHAIQRWHRHLVAQLARQTGNRTAAKDDDLGFILLDRIEARAQQHIAELLLGTRDVLDRRSQRAYARQAACKTVLTVVWQERASSLTARVVHSGTRNDSTPNGPRLNRSGGLTKVGVSKPASTSLQAARALSRSRPASQVTNRR